MTIAKEVVYALHQRLKDLSVDATPDQLAYLAKSLESIAGQSTVLDIVQMTDVKLKELLDSATSHLSKLDTSKTNALAAISESEKQSLKKIDDKGKTNLSLLDSRKDSHVATINNAGDLDSIRSTLSSLKAASDIPVGSSIMKEINTRDEQLKELTTKFNSINDVPSGSSIMEEVRQSKKNMIEPGSLPFVFGVLSRRNDGASFGHEIQLGSQLGQWYSNTSKTDSMLKLLAGAHSYEKDYMGFYRPPQIYNLQGSKGGFIYREYYLRNGSDSETYKYPHALIGVMFVKNTTNANITRSFYCLGSSGWSSGYEGAGLFVGTPNNTNANKPAVSTITWTNIYNSSSAQRFATSNSVTIPAQKTVAILLYTSSYYESTVGSFFVQFTQWGIHSFRSNFLTTGLEIDIERTLKAWQCPGLENTHQIWQ